MVLRLPVAIGDRDLLTVMAFGVVLFTLLVQGTTMQFLLRPLGLVQHTAKQLQYQRLRGRLLAVQAGQTWLQRLHNQGTAAAHVWEGLAPQLAAQAQRLRTAITTLRQEHTALQAMEAMNAHREGLLAQRSVIEAFFHDGVISEVVHSELLGEIDAALNDEQPRLLGLDDNVGEAAEP
jgi:NhaP-type Na+/H+ or K+/H+ antiporter